MTMHGKTVIRYSLSFKQHVIREIEEDGLSIEAGIKAYNEQRPHWSLNLQIPAVVHDMSNF